MMITDAMRDRLNDDRNEQRALADEANGPSDKDLLLTLYEAVWTLRQRLDEMGYGHLADDGGDDMVEVLRNEINAVSEASGEVTDVLRETRYAVKKRYGFWLDA